MLEHGFIHHCPVSSASLEAVPCAQGEHCGPTTTASAPEKKLPAQTISPSSTQQGPWEQPHLSARGWTRVSFDSTVFSERSGAQLWFRVRGSQTTGWPPGISWLPRCRHIQNLRPSQSTSFLPMPGRVIGQWQGSLSNLPSEAAPRPDWSAHPRLRLAAPESWFSD